MFVVEDIILTFYDKTMTDHVVEDKNCYGEVAVWFPLIVLLLTVGILAFFLYRYYHKSRPAYRPVDTRDQDLRRELERLHNEKEAAVLRLSEVMSSRLRDGNPNIADLSDENRPTKLRDQLSELYDNEYTEAVGVLEMECGTEFTREMAKLLLDILRFAFETCTEAAQKQLTMIQQIMARPLTELHSGPHGVDPDMENMGLSVNFMVKLKDERKMVAPDLSLITGHVESKLASTYTDRQYRKCLKSPAFHTYKDECINLSWKMSTQDPPMYLEFKEERRANLKEYTRTGRTLDFHVWPSCYLQHGGSLMAKGVAQFR